MYTKKASKEFLEALILTIKPVYVYGMIIYF